MGALFSAICSGAKNRSKISFRTREVSIGEKLADGGFSTVYKVSSSRSPCFQCREGHLNSSDPSKAKVAGKEENYAAKLMICQEEAQARGL